MNVKEAQNFLSKIGMEGVILLLVSAFSIVLVVSHILGLEYISTDRLIMITAVILALFVIYAVVKLSKLERNHKREVDFITFENIDAYYYFMIERLKHVKESIDIVNFIDPPTKETTIESRKKWFEAVGDFIKNNPKIEVRRVISIESTDKLNWVKNNQLEEFKNCLGFYVNCCALPAKHIPLLTMVIMDETEVFLGLSVAPEKSTPAPIERNLWIGNKDICDTFNNYYTALWNETIEIKRGKHIYVDRLLELKPRIL